MKSRLVIYADNPSRRMQQDIEVLMGSDVRVDEVLPVVSEPLAPDVAIAAADQLKDVGMVLIQDSETDIPTMTAEEAIAVISRLDAWTDLLRSYGVVAPHLVETKEFPRCWLILVRAVESGIPPGEGFVVDKCSKRVVQRRYIDVAKRIRTH